MMFTNKDINGYGLYATRFIASWLRMGGSLSYRNDYDDFRDWLKSLKLNDNDINSILFLAKNGKLELEISAKEFIRIHNL